MSNDLSAGSSNEPKDYRSLLKLKPDAACKPFWVCADYRIVLESHSPVYSEAEALLIAIAEPKSRTRYLQEYELTAYSLYAGASMGLNTKDILDAMDRFSKNELPPEVRQKIREETSRYGKVKLVMRAHQFFVECRSQPKVLATLLRDPELKKWQPIQNSRLDHASLRVVGRGRSDKSFPGVIRFLPSEMLGAFDNYRRFELPFSAISHLKPVARAPGVRVAGSALYELRFRVDFPTEEELKHFHTTLELGDFDPTNKPYDPANGDHYVSIGFKSEVDRLRFGRVVLPEIRRQCKQNSIVGGRILLGAGNDESARLLNEWCSGAAAEAPAAAAAGGGGEAAGSGAGAAGAAADPAAGGEAAAGAAAAAAAAANDDMAAMDALRRQAEDADDGGADQVRIEDFEVDASRVKEVKERCRELRWPLLEEYDFNNDTANPKLPIELKHDVAKIRDYQEQALSRVFGNHRARSGIIVLPCGSGKTLVGITAACTVKRSTLVLCNSSVSVNQWAQQFKMWAQIDPALVIEFTSDKKVWPEERRKEACVLISTYNMIGYTGHRSAEAREIMAEVSDREWGLCILDEVHVAPADTFLTCMTTRTRSRCKLGLTATLVREDEGIAVLNAQIGPKLYEANWLALQEKGFIATPACAEVWCDMTPEFYREYLKAPGRIQRELLHVMNPNKFRACEFLMRHHESRGDKTIIFSDNIFALEHYARKLDRPFIAGYVTHNERQKLLVDFKNPEGKFRTIFISKVGDTSIDLPEASVIIQIASHFGARRQEAQRLGRILRPKTQREKGGANAYFYTLISKDTQEMYYSGKRQQFLVDQGYAFRVILPEEVPGAGDPGDGKGPLNYSTKKEQLDILGQVLSKGSAERAARLDQEEDAEVRASFGGEGDVAAAGGSDAGVSRKRGAMSEYSGAGSVTYAEVPAVVPTHLTQNAKQAKFLKDLKAKKL